jgi:hypothetical protein
VWQTGEWSVCRQCNDDDQGARERAVACVEKTNPSIIYDDDLCLENSAKPESSLICVCSTTASTLLTFTILDEAGLSAAQLRYVLSRVAVAFKEVDASFTTERFLAITQVSGSGSSTVSAHVVGVSVAQADSVADAVRTGLGPIRAFIVVDAAAEARVADRCLRGCAEEDCGLCLATEDENSASVMGASAVLAGVIAVAVALML